MIGLLLAMGLLVLGAAASLVLVPAPRLSLRVGMSAIAGASIVAGAGALRVLFAPAPAAGETFSWALPLGRATLAIDALSAWFVLTIALLSLASAIYAIAYMKAEIAHGSVPFFSALLCVLVGSMLLAVCAGDAVVFLAAWELMSLSAFFLVAFDDKREEVRRGAWMYLIATHIGTAVGLLPMFAMLIARSGSTSFSAFASVAPAAGGALFVLGLIGFGTKAGLMPMHVWLPRAHPVAPTPVSALLSGVVVKTGVYGLLRLLTWTGPLPRGCAIAMLIIGITSGILGVLYALAQHEIKRLLAYHTVENLGIIALGIGVGMLGQNANLPAIAALGYGGALLHVLNHAMFKGLLFLSAGAVIQGAGTGELDQLGGLAKRAPANAALFLLGAVAICGLPPLNGFVSEWLIYAAMFTGITSSGSLAAAALVASIASLALMGGLALACFSKVFGVVFLGSPREGRSSMPTPRLMLSGMVVPAAACAVVGLAPGLIVPLTRDATTIISRSPAAGIDDIIGPLIAITLFALLFIALAAALVWLRHRLLHRANLPAPAQAPTWGCGYAWPTPRMQYTASSFAWPLVFSFRNALWPKRHIDRPAGPFPRHGHLHTHTDDLAENELFAPIFRGFSRLALMLKTVSFTGRADGLPKEPKGPALAAIASIVRAIRSGNIQVRVSYIVVALIVVFFVESQRSPPPNAKPQPVVAGEVVR